MHLMHLSASQSTTPQPHMAVISHEATIATPPNFGSGSMSYHQVAQPTVPLQGMQDPAAAGITNSQYPQSTGSSPLVLANDPRTTSDAAHQLPTPEAIADHGELPLFTSWLAKIPLLTKFVQYPPLITMRQSCIIATPKSSSPSSPAICVFYIGPSLTYTLDPLMISYILDRIASSIISQLVVKTNNHGS